MAALNSVSAQCVDVETHHVVSECKYVSISSMMAERLERAWSTAELDRVICAPSIVNIVRHWYRTVRAMHVASHVLGAPRTVGMVAGSIKAFCDAHSAATIIARDLVGSYKQGKMHDRRRDIMRAVRGGGDCARVPCGRRDFEWTAAAVIKGLASKGCCAGVFNTRPSKTTSNCANHGNTYVSQRSDKTGREGNGDATGQCSM